MIQNSSQTRWLHDCEIVRFIFCLLAQIHSRWFPDWEYEARNRPHIPWSESCHSTIFHIIVHLWRHQRDQVKSPCRESWWKEMVVASDINWAPGTVFGSVNHDDSHLQKWQMTWNLVNTPVHSCSFRFGPVRWSAVIEALCVLFMWTILSLVNPVSDPRSSLLVRAMTYFKTNASSNSAKSLPGTNLMSSPCKLAQSAICLTKGRDFRLRKISFDFCSNFEWIDELSH
jgi:hypothetical protein